MCGTGRGWGGVRGMVGEQTASAPFGSAQAALRREGGACRAEARAVAQWTRRQQHLLPAAPALRRRSARTSSERARAAVQQMVAQRPRGTSCWAWLLAVAQWIRRPRFFFPLRWGSRLRGAGGTVDGCAGGGGGGGRGRLEVGCGGRWHRASWRLRWRSAAASDLFHPDSLSQKNFAENMEYLWE